MKSIGVHLGIVLAPSSQFYFANELSQITEK